MSTTIKSAINTTAVFPISKSSDKNPTQDTSKTTVNSQKNYYQTYYDNIKGIFETYPGHKEYWLYDYSFQGHWVNCIWDNYNYYNSWFWIDC